MKKHINQKGNFHIIKYLEKNKNSFNCVNCSFYESGKCLKDNSICMNSSLCNYYTEEVVEKVSYSNNVKPQTIKIFNLEIQDNGEIENIKVYVSNKELNLKARRVSSSSPLGLELFNYKQSNNIFFINKTSYKIINVETEKIN